MYSLQNMTCHMLSFFYKNIEPLLQGLEWLHKKVKALYHARGQRRHR